MYQAFEFDSLNLDPHSPFFWDHVSRYWWASGQLEGKSVLDCACGKGYGSYILSHKARAVYGIDLNEKSLEIARSTFRKPSLTFRSFNVLALEKFEQPLDCVVAFEVIEHLPPAETDRFLGGIAKKLAPEGTLLLSTPNHEVVTKCGAIVPDFHINNLSAPELRAALEKHFGSVTLLGQFRKRPLLQSLLFSLDFWNLRHKLHPPASEFQGDPNAKSPEYKDTDLASFLESCPAEVGNYRFSPWHWRQAGLTVAVCRQPKR